LPTSPLLAAARSTSCQAGASEMTPITRTRFRSRYPTTSFAPGLLFLGGEQGAWYDPSDLSTLFQDAAGTVPVTTTGQAVRLMLDKSGRGNHATAPSDAARPVLQADAGGLLHLLFNGSSRSMSTSAINFTGTDKMSIFAGVTKLSDAARGMLAELSSVATNPGAFYFAAPDVAAPNFGFYLNGGAVYQPTTFTAPTTQVIAVAFNRSGATLADKIIPRFNGVVNQTNGSDAATTGNFGNYSLFIGSRNNASLRFNGRLYGLIVRGAQSSAAQITATELWMAGKTGVAI
jgi:hypothetical protein